MSIQAIYNTTVMEIIILSILSIFLTIIIGIIITLHDFDYSYILQDFMAKRESLASIIFFIQDMVLAALANSGIG